MRRSLLFLVCLSGFVPFSDLRAQVVYSFPYSFPREVQAVLASPYFVSLISQLQSEAESIGSKLEIRHVQVNVGTGVTTVDVITALTPPDASRLGPEPNPPPRRRILSFRVQGRGNGTIDVVAFRLGILRHLPDDQEPFPKELSALIVHKDYRRILEELWAELRKGRGDSASRDVIVLSGRVLLGGRAGIDLGLVNQEGPCVTLPYKTLFQPAPWKASSPLLLVGITENPARRTDVASIREGKPLHLPGSPEAGPTNRERPEEKSGTVDLVEKTKRETRRGKERREGKGRGGKK